MCCDERVQMCSHALKVWVICFSGKNFGGPETCPEIHMISENNKKRIIKEIRSLQELLNLQQWKIVLEWSDEIRENRCLAETRPNTAYRDVVIAIFQPFEDEIKKSWSDAKRVLLHEMVHVVLAPLVHTANERFVDRDSFMDSHELVTSQVEKIISKINK